MTAREKLVERLKSQPKDFEWKELKQLLNHLGYEERQGSGSRVKFRGDGLPTINLHRPHPEPTMKRYAVKQVHDILTEASLI
ncbi:type II toxin-antitoxin system HicA family toxin [Maritimibacter alexandrii]|uniref:type II toxin-antitoxin system HicA family toxin n=1 Tax=Maritimibacter alexandrii TaxID=2570355 RepID=UPI0011092582|nr:type II toxin-antitoxin system HicA family toxin [Maritimibacter alexandrii]